MYQNQSLNGISCFVLPEITLSSRGYFFLIHTDGSRRSRFNEARSAERKKKSPVSEALSNRKQGLCHIRYFENGPLEPGYPEMELYGKFHFHVVNFNFKVPRRFFFKDLEILEVIQGCALTPHGRLRRLTFNFGRLRKIPFARPGTLASSAVFSQAGTKIKLTSVGLLSQSLLNPT